MNQWMWSSEPQSRDQSIERQTNICFFMGLANNKKKLKKRRIKRPFQSTQSVHRSVLRVYWIHAFKKQTNMSNSNYASFNEVCCANSLGCLFSPDRKARAAALSWLVSHFWLSLSTHEHSMISGYWMVVKSLELLSSWKTWQFSDGFFELYCLLEF